MKSRIDRLTQEEIEELHRMIRSGASAGDCQRKFDMSSRSYLRHRRLAFGKAPSTRVTGMRNYEKKPEPDLPKPVPKPPINEPGGFIPPLPLSRLMAGK